LALLDSELQRIRYELGYNVLSVGAEPYISYVAVFDMVVQRYLNAGAKTSSLTYCAPPADPSTPELHTIVLADATGFEEGQRIWLDAGARQECVDLVSLSGTNAKFFGLKTHGESAGTLKYSVTVEGGEAIIREILAEIGAVRAQLGLAGAANASSSAAILASSGGLKRVDEIEFYAASGSSVFGGNNPEGGAQFANLKAQLNHWVEELSMALGVPNLRKRRAGSGSNLSVY
jgi:hypothetical protein